MITPVADPKGPQCQFFVVRKKRLCRMTVRPGRNYCGEHEPEPLAADGESDKRIPCPNDPKHTVYVTKLEKHLSICNARPGDEPPYIEHNVNAPPGSEYPRRPLSEIPTETLLKVIDKINALYDEHVQISVVGERSIHPVVSAEFSESGRKEKSLRHLRQVSSLLWVAQDEGLVADDTCYVELGAGKGQLSYYCALSWCGAQTRSCVVAVDRASLRHKRDNRVGRAPRDVTGAGDGAGAGAGERVVGRVRADLAHLRLELVPLARARAHTVGLAKHLCGVATDYAMRCVTSSGRCRGVVVATCCHHRCTRAALLGADRLQELGVSGADLDVMLGVVSWATCGDGRSRERRAAGAGGGGAAGRGAEARRAVGRKAKALLDWGRVLYLRDRGFHARLCHYVPSHVSLENVCIVAKKID